MPANQDSYLNKSTLRKLAQMKASERNKLIKEAGQTLRGASKDLRKAASTAKKEGQGGARIARKVANKLERAADRRKTRRNAR